VQQAVQAPTSAFFSGPLLRTTTTTQKPIGESVAQKVPTPPDVSKLTKMGEAPILKKKH
jgi:hypothetical protein